jgi:siderophore synthetase component
MNPQVAVKDCTDQVAVEQTAIERLLNCYLRETGILEPHSESDVATLNDACRERYQRLAQRGQAVALRLPATDVLLMGVCRYRSAVGHHEYEPQWWRSNGGEPPRPVTGAVELARLLVAELAGQDAAVNNRDGRIASLLAHVQNSVDKTRRYVEARLRDGSAGWDPNVADPFLTAEQSLLFGHPFHPTPKSSEGFSSGDLARFAPELRAAFRLHYFAVDPELIQEDFISGTVRAVIPGHVREAADKRLEARFRGWPLLPCHPWQHDYLRREQAVCNLIADGRLRDLGMLGNMVYPTSSVRTVWDARHEYFFKLPLNVRLTNFVRVNPLEQMQRSLAVSRALSVWQKHKPASGFSVLLEVGYRTLMNPDWDSGTRERLAASFAVLFRTNPSGVPSPMVLAAMLEPDVRGGTPAIMHCIYRAARGRGRTVDITFLREWLQRYLEISLLPLVQCFVQGGISLEAHVQNSLLAVRAGWPERFFIRDLEGASIARGIAKRHGLFRHLEENSTAFYDDGEAWHRFKYYVLVNQLGHLIAVLARHGEADEHVLWDVVRTVLQDNTALFSGKGGEDYLHDLLNSRVLPAKANFISRLQERGEHPLYVPVPNPLQVSMP